MELIEKLYCWLGLHSWAHNKGVVNVFNTSFHADMRECIYCKRQEYRKLRLFDKAQWTRLEDKKLKKQ